MVGKSLSQYKILEELGRGGMGIVYKAEDTKLNRTVAIKVLPSTVLSNEDDRARFVREAQSAAALNHSNIVSIHEIDDAIPVGDTDDGHSCSFIVMEYVEGVSLAQFIESTPIDVTEAVRIGNEIASALRAAHDKGIIHRDIKPANIMLTKSGEVKVLDFGLARRIDVAPITKEGMTVGTIHYMSPEQARSEPVNARSDLWSLGVILYQMLTSTLPFDDAYEAAILYQILNNKPEDLLALNPRVPEEISRLTHALLEKDPELRPEDAEEVIERLSQLTVTPSSAPISKSHRKAIMAFGVVLVIVAVVFAVVSRTRSVERRWAEEVGIPFLDSLGSYQSWASAATSATSWAAYRVARRVISAMPETRESYGNNEGWIGVETIASGASVAIRDGSPGAWDWVEIGHTPLDSVSIPMGFHEMRLSLAGYETVERLTGGRNRSYQDTI